MPSRKSFGPEAGASKSSETTAAAPRQEDRATRAAREKAATAARQRREALARKEAEERKIVLKAIKRPSEKNSKALEQMLSTATAEREAATQAYSSASAALLELEEQIQQKTGGFYPETVLASKPERFGMPSTSSFRPLAWLKNGLRNLSDKPVDMELARLMEDWKMRGAEVKRLKAKAGIVEEGDGPIITGPLQERVAIAKAKAARIGGEYDRLAANAIGRLDAQDYRAERGLPRATEQQASMDDQERAFFDDGMTTDERWDDATNPEMRVEMDKTLDDDDIPVEHEPMAEKSVLKEAQAEAMTAQEINEYLGANMASDEELEAGTRRPRSMLAERGNRAASMGTPSIERSQDRAQYVPLRGQEAAEVPSETPVQILRPLYEKVEARLRQVTGNADTNVKAAEPLKDLPSLKKEIDGLRDELDLYFQNLRTSDAYKWVDERIAKLYAAYAERTSKVEQRPMLDSLDRQLTDVRTELATTQEFSPDDLERVRLTLQDLEQTFGQMWGKVEGDANISRYMLLGDLLSSARGKYLEAMRRQGERDRAPAIKSMDVYRADPKVMKEIERISAKDARRATKVFNLVTEAANKLNGPQQERLKKLLGTEDAATAYVILADQLEEAWDALGEAQLTAPSNKVDALINAKGVLAERLTTINQALGLPQELFNTLTWEAYNNRPAPTVDGRLADNIQIAPELMNEVAAETSARGARERRKQAEAKARAERVTVPSINKGEQDATNALIDDANRPTLETVNVDDEPTQRDIRVQPEITVAAPRSSKKRNSLPDPDLYNAGSMQGPVTPRPTTPSRRRSAS